MCPSVSKAASGGPWLAALATLLVLTAVRAQNDPPRITERPRNQHVRAGSIAIFYCEARGDPTPTISWRKNGKKVPATQTRYQVQEYPSGSLLRIEPVRSGRDEATYECAAENGVGDAVNAEAQLKVYINPPPGFPQISLHPPTKVVEIGHTAVLTCAATGKPKPTIRWVKEMLPVQIGKNPRYTILDSGSLQITNSVEDDKANYECVAENELGTEFSRTTTLYVKARKVPPHFSIPPPPKWK